MVGAERRVWPDDIMVIDGIPMTVAFWIHFKLKFNMDFNEGEDFLLKRENRDLLIAHWLRHQSGHHLYETEIKPWKKINKVNV